MPLKVKIAHSVQHTDTCGIHHFGFNVTPLRDEPMCLGKTLLSYEKHTNVEIKKTGTHTGRPTGM